MHVYYAACPVLAQGYASCSCRRERLLLLWCCPSRTSPELSRVWHCPRSCGRDRAIHTPQQSGRRSCALRLGTGTTRQLGASGRRFRSRRSARQSSRGQHRPGPPGHGRIVQGELVKHERWGRHTAATPRGAGRDESVLSAATTSSKQRHHGGECRTGGDEKVGFSRTTHLIAGNPATEPDSVGGSHCPFGMFCPVLGVWGRTEGWECRCHHQALILPAPGLPSCLLLPHCLLPPCPNQGYHRHQAMGTLVSSPAEHHYQTTSRPPCLHQPYHHHPFQAVGGPCRGSSRLRRSGVTTTTRR